MFLILANFNLFEFLAAILEKGLLPDHIGSMAKTSSGSIPLSIKSSRGKVIAAEDDGLWAENLLYTSNLPPQPP